MTFSQDILDISVDTLDISVNDGPHIQWSLRTVMELKISPSLTGVVAQDITQVSVVDEIRVSKPTT